MYRLVKFVKLKKKDLRVDPELSGRPIFGAKMAHFLELIYFGKNH